MGTPQQLSNVKCLLSWSLYPKHLFRRIAKNNQKKLSNILFPSNKITANLEFSMSQGPMGNSTVDVQKNTTLHGRAVEPRSSGPVDVSSLDLKIWRPERVLCFFLNFWNPATTSWANGSWNPIVGVSAPSQGVVFFFLFFPNRWTTSFPWQLFFGVQKSGHNFIPTHWDPGSSWKCISSRHGFWLSKSGLLCVVLFVCLALFGWMFFGSVGLVGGLVVGLLFLFFVR